MVALASAPLGVFEFVLPMYGRALGASATAIGVLFSSFSATAILARLILSWGLDRWGRRRVLLAGLAGYVVSMVVFALADSINGLLVARLVQGLASTATWLAVSVFLTIWSDAQERGEAFGWLQVIGTWGAGVGAAWAMLSIGLLDAGARAEIERTLGRLNWPWLALPAPGALRVVFVGYIVASSLALLAALWLRGEGSGAVDTAFAAFAAVWSAGFGVLLRAAPGGALLLVGLLRGAALTLTSPVLVLYLADRFGAGNAALVVAAVVPGIVYALAPQPLGRLADRIGHRRAALWATLLSAVTFMVMPAVPVLWALALLWVAEALSFSLATPAISALIAAGIVPERTGSAFARYALASSVGVAFGPILGGWLYEQVAISAPFVVSGLLFALAVLPLRLKIED